MSRIKIKPNGFTDGMTVIMPNGERLETECNGIISFIASNFKYGEITEIILSSFGCSINKKDMFDLKQITGAEVLIDEE